MGHRRISDEGAVAALHTAIDSGANFIHAADVYGAAANV
jgi:aryl-alcohol dehydrogenase-like predicted oxidoreductase